VQAGDGGGDYAEVREGRVAAADGWVAIEDVAEVAVFGDLLHLGAGVGDGDEVAASVVVADGVLHLLEEILLEDVGLKGGAGLAGDDDERLLEIEAVADGLDLLGVGGVEDVERGEVRLAAEGERKHLRAEAGAAHAEEEDVAEAAGFDVCCEGGEAGEIGVLALDNVDPAHPFLLAVAGPEGGVALPEAGELVIGVPAGDGCIDGVAEIDG
jgi:hypothetical protein